MGVFIPRQKPHHDTLHRQSTKAGDVISKSGKENEDEIMTLHRWCIEKHVHISQEGQNDATFDARVKILWALT